MFTFILSLTIWAVIAICLCFLVNLPIYWLIVIGISPFLLLLCWKKSTLASSQKIFSVVFALALGCLTLFSGNNALVSVTFFNDSLVFYSCYFAILIVFASVASFILSLLVHRHYVMFAIGVLFGIASVCIPQNTLVLCTIVYVLIALSASCLLCAMNNLNKKINKACKILEVKNVSISMLLRNLAFVLVVINVFIILVAKLGNAQDIHVASLSSNIVAAVLLFVLLFTYVRQPLDDVAESKMKFIQENTETATLAKEQLKDRLNTVQNYPLATVGKLAFRNLIPCKVVGLEKVDDKTACFVANHYEIYGPLATYLHFPLPACTWTEAQMTNRNQIARQLQSGLKKLFGFLGTKGVKGLARLIAYPLCRCIDFTRPIPVYRMNKEKTDKMLLDSVDALITGDNILVFPEKTPPGSHYKGQDVDPLQTRFIEIANKYNETTGQELSFYPLYIDKKGKQMIVGDKVTYNSTSTLHDEKLRISQELHGSLSQMAETCKNSRK